MDPTLESVLKSIPGGNNVIDKFTLLLQNQPAPSNAKVGGTVGASSVTHVTGGLLAPTIVCNTSQSANSELAKKKLDSIPIKVLNPCRKRESKSYMLNLNINSTHNLKHLREEILEQLGKELVSFDLKFDVGYFVAARKICFVDTDNVKMELVRIRDNGRQLWCNGKESVVLLDEDDAPAPKKKLKDDQKVNALEQKEKWVDELAVKLKEKHKEFNKIQCKLWAEAIDSGQHKSTDTPPPGTIWNNAKEKTKPKTSENVGAIANAVTNMAEKVALALNTSKSNETSSDKEKHSSTACANTGISPGKKIDYQEKLLNQVDLLHRMFERGAITVDQFEKRRESLLTQLDSLSNS